MRLEGGETHHHAVGREDAAAVQVNERNEVRLLERNEPFPAPPTSPSATPHNLDNNSSAFLDGNRHASQPRMPAASHRWWSATHVIASTRT